MSSIKSSWAPAALALAALAALPAVATAAVVVRDAETGQLRAPTAAEAAELARPAAPAAASARTLRAAPATAAPMVRLNANGSLSATLDESMMTYAVVRVGENGKLERECVTGAQAAEQALQGRKAFASPLKRSQTTAREATLELK